METKNKTRNQAIAMLVAILAVTLMNVHEGLVGMVMVLFMIALVVIIIHSTLHPEVWNETETEEDYE